MTEETLLQKKYNRILSKSTKLVYHIDQYLKYTAKIDYLAIVRLKWEIVGIMEEEKERKSKQINLLK